MQYSIYVPVLEIRFPEGMSIKTFYSMLRITSIKHLIINDCDMHRRCYHRETKLQVCFVSAVCIAGGEIIVKILCLLKGSSPSQCRHTAG